MTARRILPGRQHPVSRALIRIRLLRHFAREQARRESCRICWGRRTIMSWRTAKDLPCPECTPGVPAAEKPRCIAPGCGGPGTFDCRCSPGKEPG